METGSTGNATLEGLPANAEVASTMEKAGFASYVDSYLTGADSTTIIVGMATEQRLQEQHESMGSPYPMEGTGMIYIDTGVTAGVTFTLVDTTGEPFYRDEEADFDPDLTATTARGGGGFLEVSPGEHVVEIGGTDVNCTIARGWPGDSENSVRLPVREGFMSRARLECEETAN